MDFDDAVNDDDIDSEGSSASVIEIMEEDDSIISYNGNDNSEDDEASDEDSMLVDEAIGLLDDAIDAMDDEEEDFAERVHQMVEWVVHAPIGFPLRDSSSEDDVVEVTHYGVTCDECGASPIRGTLYHSTRIIDYDICSQCYNARHKAITLRNAFRIYKQPKAHHREDGLFENPGKMRVNSSGWASLQDVLCNNPQLMNLDINFNRRFRRHAEAQQPTEEGRQAIQSNLASSKTLKVIYAKFPATDQEVHSQSIKALLGGISASHSVMTLNLTLDFTWQSAIRDVCNLIRNNRSVRFLFVQHFRNSSRRPIAATAGNNNNNNNNNSNLLENQEGRAVAVAEEEILRRAHDLFQALRETSIHSFVCRGVPDLGLDCYDASLAALKTRPSLKRIKAPFATAAVDAKKQKELERLMQEKDEHWMKDWNDPNATAESRVQVLEEVLSCKQVDEQDQVAALFHFVRSNPGSLPELHPQET